MTQTVHRQLRNARHALVRYRNRTPDCEANINIQSVFVSLDIAEVLLGWIDDAAHQIIAADDMDIITAQAQRIIEYVALLDDKDAS